MLLLLLLSILLVFLISCIMSTYCKYYIILLHIIAAICWLSRDAQTKPSNLELHAWKTSLGDDINKTPQVLHFPGRTLLSSSDPHSAETLFWHSFWHTIWKYIWLIHYGILSDTLSGIYFDILSGIYSEGHCWGKEEEGGSKRKEEGRGRRKEGEGGRKRKQSG